MFRLAATALLATSLLAPAAAEAQTSYRPRSEPDATGSIGGRAPWNAPYEFDSGSDNDKHPSRPYYQQGRGQQTGGPTRNLLPGDGYNLSPR